MSQRNRSFSSYYSLLLILLILPWFVTLNLPAEELAHDPRYEFGKDFRQFNIGPDMPEFAFQLGHKLNEIKEKKRLDKLHLLMLVDTTSSMQEPLAQLGKELQKVFGAAPKGLSITVVALRAPQPTIVATECDTPELLRISLHKTLDMAKDAQNKAVIDLNPAQRLQVRAMDNPIFLTLDDCVKDWCSAVHWCLKEVHGSYPFQAMLVMTLDNADTENNIEGVVAALKQKDITFMAAAPDTYLPMSDVTSAAERWKFYKSTQEKLKLDYGPEFHIHRRESAYREISSVPGLNSAHENVGCPTGWGFYGLARCGFATEGAYFIIQDSARPLCACNFHRPDERLTRGGGAAAGNDPQKPPALPWNRAEGPRFKNIAPFMFEDEEQQKYEPCLLSRAEVQALYQSSSFYRYLFSLTGGGAGGLANRGNLDGGNSRIDPIKGNYRVFQVTEWEVAGAAPAQEPDPAYEEWPPLRVHEPHSDPIPPWRGGIGGDGQGRFHALSQVVQEQEAYKAAAQRLDEEIKSLLAGVPKDEPGRWEHRAKAQIYFFIMCLENNRFYVEQYHRFLGDMVNIPEVKDILSKFPNEEAAKAELERLRKGNGPGRGPQYIEVNMPRLLKQRCEGFHEALNKRPPLYGAGLGMQDRDRFVRALGTMKRYVATSTWTNFWDLGWQRQYHYFIRQHTWGGGGGGGGSQKPKPQVPKPPTYAPPGSPSGPRY